MITVFRDAPEDFKELKERRLAKRRIMTIKSSRRRTRSSPAYYKNETGLLCLRAKPFRGSESPPDSHSLPLPFKSRLKSKKQPKMNSSCSCVCKGCKKDIFRRVLTGFEPYESFITAFYGTRRFEYFVPKYSLLHYSRGNK